MLFKKYPVENIIYGRPWLYKEVNELIEGKSAINYKALSFYDLLIKTPGMHGEENYVAVGFGGEYPGVSNGVCIADVLDMGNVTSLNRFQICKLESALNKTGLNISLAYKHIKEGKMPKLSYKELIKDKKVSQKALT